MKLRSVKFWNLIGVIAGVAIIILGIVLANTPAQTYSTASSQAVTFGADYYTYQYEASKNTVTNTAVTANNLRELGEKAALYAGWFFIVIGVLVALCYLKKYFLEEEYYFTDDEIMQEEIMQILEEAGAEDEEPVQDADAEEADVAVEEVAVEEPDAEEAVNDAE